jgi:nicotinate-nucleotide adenylyltransferase
MKVGLFGGTFNPIHHCHLSVARQVRDRLALDRIVFIPSSDPPHKPTEDLAPARHRVEMVRRAIEPEPSFTVSEIETSRPGKSYSIDTVRELLEEHGPALYFILGLDAFRELPDWREPAELLRLCHFVVVSRPGSAFLNVGSMPLLPALDRDALKALDSGGAGRLDVPLSGGRTLILLPLPPCDASASDIRKRLRRRLDVSRELPASVQSYIIQFGLYQEESDHTRV